MSDKPTVTDKHFARFAAGCLILLGLYFLVGGYFTDEAGQYGAGIAFLALGLLGFVLT